ASAEQLEAHSRLLDTLGGFMATQAIAVVARLGVADHIVDEPVSADRLAAEVGADPDALFRFLRFLSSTGIFTQPAPRCFAHSPMSLCLRSGAPGSLRYLAMCFGEEHYRAWGDALHSVRTGAPAFSRVFGTPFFNYLEANPEAGATFNRAMANTAAARAIPMLAYPWGDVAGTVVDVGGGNGFLLTVILEANPHLSGVVFDMADAVSQARERIAAAGLAGRCRAVEGSFFDEAPAAGTQVLSQILHDWDDDDALRILRSCRRSINPDGRLLILEYVVPSGDTPSRAKLLDLHMLVLLGGREGTEAQWRVLLERGGFRVSRIFPAARTDLIEAVPIQELCSTGMRV
ncbi:MAG: methyltransferase, partial [Candidatus Dormibacteria bacterium]